MEHDQSKKELWTENVALKLRIKELEKLLGIRKQKSVCVRIKCSLHEFWKEFNRI